MSRGILCTGSLDVICQCRCVGVVSLSGLCETCATFWSRTPATVKNAKKFFYLLIGVFHCSRCFWCTFWEHEVVRNARTHTHLPPVRAAHTVQPPPPLLDACKARLVRRREHRPADPIRAEAVARFDLRRKPSSGLGPLALRRLPVSARACLELSPKLRPASANQPLGPHWPAMQA